MNRVIWKSICVCSAFNMVMFIPSPVHATGDALHNWLDAIDDVNPTVIAAHRRWQAAQAMAPQAAGWPDPMLGVNVERNNTRMDDYMGLEYMLEQEIPWPGRLRTERDIARLEAEAVGFELLEVRRQVRAKITEATWSLWATRKAVDVAAEQLKLTESLTHITQARFESGQAPQTELIRMQVELDRLRNETVTMEREVDVALSRLNALLNASPQTPRSTDIMPALPELTLSVKQLQEDARQYCCILMATLWREMARDLGRTSAKLAQRPNLAVNVAARHFRESGSIDEIDTGIAMSIPWLWGGKYRGRRAEAEADYQMAQAMLEEEVAMTLVEIQEVYTEAESRLRTMKLYEEKILPQTRALADSSREAYPSGSMSAFELLDALRMVQDAQLTSYRETAAYAGAFAKLMAIAQPWTPDEFDTGLPLHMEEAK